jgi:hypothetical protein
MKYILLILAALLASIPAKARSVGDSAPAKAHSAPNSAPVPTFYPNQFYDANQMGVDCNGKTDSSAALQAAINTLPDGGAVLFHTGCNVKLSSTINIISRMNVRVGAYSDNPAQPAGQTQPTLMWTDPGAVVQATISGTVMTVNSVTSGTLKVHDILSGVGSGIHTNGPGNPYITSFGTFNGTSGTVNLSTAATVSSAEAITATGMMFNIESSGYIIFDGLEFANDGVNGNVANFLNWDMSGEGGVTGTRGIAKNNTFQFYGVKNPVSVAVSIAQSTQNNLENFQINNNFFACGGSEAVKKTQLGVMSSGSPNLSASDAPFTSGMVGETIWVSYPGGHGLLRTTVASYSSPTAVVLNANAQEPISGASVFIGQSYSTGIYLGPGGNDIHEQFDSNIMYDCDYGIYADGGSFSMHHMQGGYGDYGVFVNGNWLQDEIDFYENEQDLRGIEASSISGAPILITNMRGSNGNQLADGFLKLGGGIFNLIGAQVAFVTPTNGVFVGSSYGTAPTLTSIGNYFGLLTWAQTGYGVGNFLSYPPVSLNDSWNGGQPGVDSLGCQAGGTPCLGVTGAAGGSGGPSAQIDTEVSFGVPTFGSGLKITSGSLGGGVDTYIGEEVQGTALTVYSSETLIKADWPSGTIDTSRLGAGSISEFYAAAPSAINNPLANFYGLYIEPLQITNVTTAWGIYQAGTSDQNYFAGHTTFGAGVSLAGSTVASLPTCNSASKGSMRYVTDAAAAPTYNAAVSGGGSVVIPVFCNGTQWTNH